MSDEYVSVPGDAQDAQVVFCWRYEGQHHLPNGTQIDRVCSRCFRRVCLDPNGQRFADQGAELVCQECAPPEALDLVRSEAQRRGLA